MLTSVTISFIISQQEGSVMPQPSQHDNWCGLTNDEQLLHYSIKVTSLHSQGPCPSECIIYRRLLQWQSYQHVDTKCDFSG